MISESKNLERFIKEINRTADAAVASIRKETDKYVNNELRKARELAHQEINAAQFTLLDKFNQQNNTDFSEAEKAERQSLLQRRQQITDEVFALAQERIRAFTAGEDYAGFLQKSAQALSALAGEDAVFYIRPEDRQYESLLCTYCARICYDESIRLGGIRALNEKEGLAADDTLDERLHACREIFYEKSGLSITL